MRQSLKPATPAVTGRFFAAGSSGKKRAPKILAWTFAIPVVLAGGAIGAGYLFLTSDDFHALVESHFARGNPRA